MRPLREHEGNKEVGRIGAKPKLPEAIDPSLAATERYGLLAAIPRALDETWDTTWVTLKFLYKMVSGQASAKNLGGPISIAQSAGVTARLGLGAFLSFIAVISVSLGVLNLLPIPVLDGGHLMYYLIELLAGKPVSLTAQRVGQQLGMLILGFIMCVAFYNDIVRVLG
jgi:regulator of sigma E protease